MQTSRRRWNYPNKTSLTPLRPTSLYEADARTHSVILSLHQSCKLNITQCGHEFVSYVSNIDIIDNVENISLQVLFSYKFLNSRLTLNACIISRFFSLSRFIALFLFTLTVTIPRDIPPNRKVPPGRSFSWRNRCNRYEKPNSQMAKIKLSDSWQSQETTLLHGDKFEARILARGHATWCARITN